MDVKKSQAVSFLGLALALSGFGCLASGHNMVVMFVIATLFALSALLLVCSIKFEPGWLQKTAGILVTIRVSYLVLFLGLIGLAMILIQRQLIIPGIIIVYLAYAFCGLSIGRDIGDVLRDVWKKLRRRA